MWDSFCYGLILDNGLLYRWDSFCSSWPWLTMMQTQGGKAACLNLIRYAHWYYAVPNCTLTAFLLQLFIQRLFSVSPELCSCLSGRGDWRKSRRDPTNVLNESSRRPEQDCGLYYASSAAGTGKLFCI